MTPAAEYFDGVGVSPLLVSMSSHSGGELAAMINQLMTGGATIISAQEVIMLRLC